MLSIQPSAPKSSLSSNLVAIRFLEDRVAHDPDDVVALNKLSAYYLQSYRETYDNAYLELAHRSAKASLKVLGTEQNLGALIALAQARFALHDFASAVTYGRQLIEYQPDKSSGYQVLGDALLELGEYQQAIATYARMAELDPGSVATESRLARLAFLRGETSAAKQRYKRALEAEMNARVPSTESIAWCHWQLGETAFQGGQYREAEQHYHNALKAFPNYVRALGSLGRVRAALNDRAGAIELYEHAVGLVPEPLYLIALGDLYQLAGKSKEAEEHYAVAEQVGKLNQANDILYGRQLTLFYADHDRKAAEAFESAAREYAVRHDVYGADVLAWTAFKASKLSEAENAIKQALSLGTRDARFFYHAALIERATGNQKAAENHLMMALSLNPEFDPLQSSIAKQQFRH